MGTGFGVPAKRVDTVGLSPFSPRPPANPPTPMCGIAGYLTAGPPPSQALVERMCDRLTHRVPTPPATSRTAKSPSATGGLSNHRPQHRDQPLGNEDGSLQIVFNGEIYNYRELRKDLQARGHHFRTQSDTECSYTSTRRTASEPERLNGMFAFAIWDAPRRTLFLARDRFGKKLSTTPTPSTACDLPLPPNSKPSKRYPASTARSTRAALADSSPSTTSRIRRPSYRGVHKLPPAHSLT